MRDPVTVLARLAAAPREHEFNAALRLVECAWPQLPRIGASQRPQDDAVRIGQIATLAFAPAMIDSLVTNEAGTPPRLMVSFLGLLGANGPLPEHLTEYVRDRTRNAGDPTLARFLDVFHHRVLSLFYRAWSSSQPAVSFDRPHDNRFGNYPASLIGLGTPGLAKRDAVPDLAKLHYAGRLASQTRNAEGLAAVLGDDLGVPVRVEQFVGHRLMLEPADRMRVAVGFGGGRLGLNAVIGRSVWNRQHKFRLHVGPLDFAQFLRLLPGEPAFRRLVDWVRQYAGDALDWDARLVLRREQIPRLRLVGRPPLAPALGIVVATSPLARLGRTTWLLARPPACDSAHLTVSAALRAPLLPTF